MADDLEKTEEPTDKRRTEAQREGTIASSQEIYTVANLLAVTLTLMFLGKASAHRALEMFPRLWVPRDDLTIAEASELLKIAFSSASVVLGPVFLAAVVGGLVAGIGQTGGRMSPKRIQPKAAKISPLKNGKRIITKTMPIELPKSIMKMTITGAAIAFAVWPNIPQFRGLQRLTLVPAMTFQLSIVLQALLAGALALILVAAMDYAYQYWQTEKSLKMSKSEVDDEHKQSQGDPLVRRRVMSLMLERRRDRMIQAVPEADVIVTNPTHISCALRYDRDNMGAPILVAKGAGFIAFKIRDIGREAGIPIIENKPLARTLFRSVKVGQMIPETLFQAVAEVLAYIYKLDRSRGTTW